MKQAIRFFSAMLAIMLAWQVSQAQNRAITGTVKDPNGDAIIGASVIVKGTTTGTYSDENGNYTLSVPSNATTLIFKYLGFKTQEVALTASNVVNVTLEEDVLGLDEVVVTAIGISSEKKKLAYAVQDVSGEQITAAGNNNTMQSLGGKVAGLKVISASGAPGSSVYMQLRGTTSITGDNQPLFVVDGVPLDNSYNYSGNPDNVGALINNNLLESVNNSNRAIDINPDDVASITVLKGPAATALYGIRAAHGAIIITTKKGGAAGTGKGIHATYSSTFTYEEVNKLPDLQNEYVKGTGDALRSYESSSSGSWGPAVHDENGTLQLYWDPAQATNFNQYGQLVQTTNPDTFGHALIPFTPYDNADQFFRKGHTFENNIALSGGGDNGGFRLSFGALNQDGIVPLSTFDRYTAKLAGETQLSSKFNIGGSVTYIKSGGNRVQQGSNLSGLMLDLLRTPISFDNSNGSDDPTDPSAYILADGTQRNYRGGVGYDNPYWTINQNPFVDDVNRVYGYGEVGYSPWTWLKLTERLGNDFYSDRRNQHFAVGSRAIPDGQIFTQDYFYRHFNNDVLATATKDFSDKFSASLTVGNNVFSQYTEQVYVQGDNLNIPDFYNMSNASNVLSRNSVGRYRTYAFYGSLDLGIANQLYLTVTARNEWSSTLPQDNNSFFYPSVAASWVFTEPLGLSNSKAFPYGKLRASWAQVGNDAPIYVLGTYFSQVTAADGWTSGIAYPLPDRDGNQTTSYGYSATLGNPNLKPEKVTSWEVGADLRFVNNKIGLDVTYYESKSEDQIVPAPIAGSTGFQQQYLNSGSIKNSGFEVALNLTPVKTKDWKWDIGVNWSTNKSEVLSLAEGVDILFLGGFEGSAIYAVQGQPYGTIYGGRWLRDASGAIVIGQDGYPIPDAQIGVIGDVNPDWISGINTTVSWKGLSLYALFDIRQGGDIWNGTRGALTFFGRTDNTLDRGTTTTFEGNVGVFDQDGNLLYDANGFPQTEGKNTTVATLDQAWYQGNGGGFGPVTEQFIEDGSYVKLKEVSLTYSISPKALERTPIAGLDISLIGRNLWLQTDYKGVDPETSLTGANNSQGMDYFNMPGTRSYGLNVRLTL
ncbi:MAG: SusC/RagA family TonB-linked outer membrane protein [Bacteroidetes bacterium]|nr:SusC/RagA family TonB-linked outer membrane protein [Bacteroidota bacterium]